MDVRRSKRPGVVSVLRTILYALLIAFVIGLVIGSLLRRELERPTRYIGSQMIDESWVRLLPLAADPGDVGNALTRVLMTSDHKKQIRESVQVAKRRFLDRLAIHAC